MHTLRIEHGVRDYESWKSAFDSDPVGRRAGGVRAYRVSRPTDDPRYVVVDLEFETAAEAESFHGKLRELWGDVGPDLGLDSPSGRVLEVVESATL